ncbi:MAG: zf-HC2 domain-containing protein [Bryobacteraceae bacterium]
MSDHPRQEQLALYLTHDLSAPESRRVAAHLENCPACLECLADFERAQETLKGVWPEPSGEDLTEVRQRVMRGRRRREAFGIRWILAMSAAAVVALICLFQLVWPSVAHYPAVTEARPRIAISAEPKTPAPAVVKPPETARIVPHRRSPGLRSVALITPLGEPPLIRMNTADPKVVILLQTGEMQSDERTREQ